MNEVFVITKENGEWLCSEDRRLYHLQIQSKGSVGYTTGKAASCKTIHPSKRKKVTVKPNLRKSTTTKSTTAITRSSTTITKSTTATSSSESESESDSDYQECESSGKEPTSKK